MAQSGYRRWLRQTAAIVKKDLRRELHSREVTMTTLSFAVLLMVIFTFSFYQKGENVELVFPGILWVSIVFAGTLAVSRTFTDERDSGCLRALALIPGTGLSMYCGKLITNLCFMVAFELPLIPLLIIAFDAPITGQLIPFCTALVAGTLGFGALGTLVAAMLVHHRLREVLVPLLLYPLLVPLLIGGVKAVALLQKGGAQQVESAWGWIRLMFALDLVFVIGAAFLFKWVLEAIE